MKVSRIIMPCKLYTFSFIESILTPYIFIINMFQWVDEHFLDTNQYTVFCQCLMYST